jgi:hypothetical protein
MATCAKCRGMTVLELVDGLRQVRCPNCGALSFPGAPGQPDTPAANGNGVNRRALLLGLPATFKLADVVDAWRADGGKTYADLRLELEAVGYQVSRPQVYQPDGREKPGPLWAERA